MKKTGIFAVIIFTVSLAAGHTPAQEQPVVATPTTTSQENPAPAPKSKKPPRKNIFGEDAKNNKKREGWAGKELRKEGYEPGKMTGKDYRKILGAE